MATDRPLAAAQVFLPGRRRADGGGCAGLGHGYLAAAMVNVPRLIYAMAAEGDLRPAWRRCTRASDPARLRRRVRRDRVGLRGCWRFLGTSHSAVSRLLTYGMVSVALVVFRRSALPAMWSQPELPGARRHTGRGPRPALGGAGAQAAGARGLAEPWRSAWCTGPDEEPERGAKEPRGSPRQGEPISSGSAAPVSHPSRPRRAASAGPASAFLALSVKNGLHLSRGQGRDAGEASLRRPRGTTTSAAGARGESAQPRRRQLAPDSNEHDGEPDPDLTSGSR
jgi:hypothetical protein